MVTAPVPDIARSAVIYDVTRALRLLLYSRLVRVNPAAVVTLHPPGESLPQALGVNLYLYRVAESPSTKNRDWPGDATTAPTTAPALGLVLSYLLTPLGTTPDDQSVTLGDDAHTMLGAAMSVLADYPILNDAHVPKAGSVQNSGFDADAVLTPPLLNSYEQIKISLMPTSVDELSKIWATINQPYRLSIAYEVAIVEIPPTVAPSVDGRPVSQSQLSVQPIQLPVIDALVPSSGAVAEVTAGDVLVSSSLKIAGSGFSSPLPALAPTVTVGGLEATVLPRSPLSATTLTALLPLELQAGPLVSVTVSVAGRAGAPATFAATPWLQQITPIRTPLSSDTAVTLLGTGFTTAPSHVRCDAGGKTTNLATFSAGGTDTRATLVIPAAALPNGLYALRLVRTDGGATNALSLEVIPLITAVSVTVLSSGPASPLSPPSGAAFNQLGLSGSRFLGSDVRALVDGTEYLLDPSAVTATSIVLTLGKLLAAGAHVVAVCVDGHLSPSFGFTV